MSFHSPYSLDLINVPNVLKYTYRVGEYWMDPLLCGQYLVDLWEEHSVVIFNTITDMSLLITRNVHHLDTMISFGIVSTREEHLAHYELLHFAYRVLFANTDSINSQIDLWRPQFKKHRIGVQLRFGGAIANSQEQMIYLDRNDVISFANGVKDYCNRSHISMNNVTIHVSTDSNYGWEAMMEYFPDQVFSPHHHIIGHSSLVFGTLRGDVYRSAIIDIALLRECEYLILTDGSSFGYTFAIQQSPWKGSVVSRGMGAKSAFPQPLKLLTRFCVCSLLYHYESSSS